VSRERWIQEDLMPIVIVVLIVSGMLVAPGPGAWAEALRVAQAAAPAPAPAPQAMPGKLAADAVQVRGTIDAIDKEKGTVTLKGPKGRTLTLEVRDPAKLDAVKVGDPVVATYMEAVAFQVRKSGTATPGTSVQEARVGSKPGETPGGAIGREVTVVVTITAIDKKAPAVTIKGPQGKTETFKVREPKNLEGVKVGDLVEITYTQALAVTLDKPAK
jgi:Cu/Ag efflux protein CusF